MLRHRIVGASIVFALPAGIAAGIMLSRPGPGTPPRLASVQPAAATQAPATPQSTPPPMPDGVTHPPTLVTLHDRGGGTLSCSGHGGVASWDPSLGWPRTITDLYHQADVVVLATAVETRGFWQRDDGHLPAQNQEGFDWASFTATNFHVDHIYKGAGAISGAWLQIVDYGADPASLTTCQGRAFQFEGWPQPLAGGQQYVLFLQAAPTGLHEGYGPIDRWPVINGVVHPDHDLQRSAWQTVPGTPMPLDQFIAAMQS